MLIAALHGSFPLTDDFGFQELPQNVDMEGLAKESMYYFNLWCEKYPDSPLIEFEANEHFMAWTVASVNQL